MANRGIIGLFNCAALREVIRNTFAERTYVIVP